MPHKVTQTVEYCSPCKWYTHRMVKSGLHPVYHSACNHPQEVADDMFDRTERGHTIHGQYRPSWCPIRGDAQAEMDAERDE